MNNDKIIDRIKKLFALASNNSNENEANVAMNQARKMLDRHNLSKNDLVNDNSVGVIIEDNTNMPYIRIIYNYVSMLYDCQYITLSLGSRKAKHAIIGLESNRVTSSIVSNFIIDEIKKHSIGKGNGYRNSASIAIKERIEKIINERMNSNEEIVPGSGLMPFDIYEQNKINNDDFIKSRFNTVLAKTIARANNEGKKLGNKININPHLSNRRAIK